jgi:hypothetical protein
MAIQDRIAALGKSCRHWRPRDSLHNKGCAIGHPIEKIVMAANGGERTGIAYMFPCRPGPERKADCPDYDPKTDAEIAAEKDALRKRMDDFVKVLPVINALRTTMAANKIARQIVDCPWCNTPASLHVSCAVGYNNHLSAKCKECGEGFIE